MTVMTNDFHELAMDVAEEADMALRSGNREVALFKFRRAAEYEMQAIATIDKDAARTLGIHVVAGVSLLLSAGEFTQAMSLTDRYRDLLPHGFVVELDELIQKAVKEESSG